MYRRYFKMIAVALFLSLGVASFQPAMAATVPSKTAEHQSLTARQADLNHIHSVIGQEQVAQVLEQQGFTSDQVNSRLALLSDQEIQSLSKNIDQIQAAGITQAQWTWMLIGAVVILALVLVAD